MKKLFLLCLLLAVAFCLAACSGDVAETTEAPNGTVTEDVGETLGIPLTADYGDYEFNILTAATATLKIINQFYGETVAEWQ